MRYRSFCWDVTGAHADPIISPVFVLELTSCRGVFFVPRCSSYGCRWRSDSSSNTSDSGVCVWVGEAEGSSGAADLEFVMPPDCLAQIPRAAKSLLSVLPNDTVR